MSELAVRVRGDGPAVVWVHGYTMDAGVFEPLWDLLPGWRHVGVDLPGHGATSRPLRADDRWSSLAATLAPVLVEHAATRVVALSFGSTVALQLAVDHPELVDRLLLGAPTIAGRAEAPGAGRRYAQLFRAFRAFGAGPHMTSLWMSSPPDIFTGTERNPVARERLRRVVDAHRWRELGDGAMAGLGREVQTVESLGTLRARTFCLVGENDMPAFPANAETLRDACGAEVTTVPGAGHLPLLEVPEDVAGLVEERLAGA